MHPSTSTFPGPGKAETEEVLLPGCAALGRLTASSGKLACLAGGSGAEPTVRATEPTVRARVRQAVKTVPPESTDKQRQGSYLGQVLEGRGSRAQKGRSARSQG